MGYLFLKSETYMINHFLQFLNLRFNKGHNELIVCQLETLKSLLLPVVMVSRVEAFSW